VLEHEHLLVGIDTRQKSGAVGEQQHDWSAMLQPHQFPRSSRTARARLSRPGAPRCRRGHRFAARGVKICGISSVPQNRASAIIACRRVSITPVGHPAIEAIRSRASVAANARDEWHPLFRGAPTRMDQGLRSHRLYTCYIPAERALQKAKPSLT
jgi:hypothetical protein